MFQESYLHGTILALYFGSQARTLQRGTIMLTTKKARKSSILRSLDKALDCYLTHEKLAKPTGQRVIETTLQRDRMPIGDDYIREGITSAAPGSSERIQALCAFYDMAIDTEESAFSL